MIEFNPIPLKKSIDKTGLKFKTERDVLERFIKELKKFLSLTYEEEIDKMVYTLYELTKEDKMIVEERDS